MKLPFGIRYFFYKRLGGDYLYQIGLKKKAQSLRESSCGNATDIDLVIAYMGYLLANPKDLYKDSPHSLGKHMADYVLSKGKALTYVQANYAKEIIGKRWENEI